MKPLVDNAGDEKQVLRAEAREKYLARKQKEDLRFVLSTPIGRRVLKRILDSTMIDSNAFVEKDASKTFYYLGMQRVGAILRERIAESDSIAYLAMIEESRKENLSLEQERLEVEHE